jgi:hypothetical protein
MDEATDRQTHQRRRNLVILINNSSSINARAPPGPDEKYYIARVELHHAAKTQHISDAATTHADSQQFQVVFFRSA